MRKAGKDDKKQVIDILCAAFANNKSVQYIIKQDRHTAIRIRKLMNYSYEMCVLKGAIYISDDALSCALVTLPGKTKLSLRATWLDIRLLFQCIGFSNIKKVMSREALIKKQYPLTPFTYLWFLGVMPGSQQKGLGSAMLQYVLQQHNAHPTYLETSAAENLPFYLKHGFSVYHEEELSYKLFFLKKEIQ
ncbi:MAG: GNAT family N-acetyltransferase [Filimonas sp.]|nr:GNAT family N-acetyltransferase [Filimonas sp.]